jgi:hypothetical protein
MTTFEGLVYLSKRTLAQPSQSGVCTVEKGNALYQSPSPNVRRDDGVLGTPEALLRYKALGGMYSEPSVHGVNTIPHRNVISHVARTGPDFYDAGEQPQDHRKLSWASEYGHDYDATIDYGWGVGLALIS